MRLKINILEIRWYESIFRKTKYFLNAKLELEMTGIFESNALKIFRSLKPLHWLFENKQKSNDEWPTKQSRCARGLSHTFLKLAKPTNQLKLNNLSVILEQVLSAFPEVIGFRGYIRKQNSPTVPDHDCFGLLFVYITRHFSNENKFPAQSVSYVEPLQLWCPEESNNKWLVIVEGQYLTICRECLMSLWLETVVQVFFTFKISKTIYHAENGI